MRYFNYLTLIILITVQKDGTSSNWSLDGFVRVIERAILLMKQAKQYELCIELYSMLVLAYKNTLNHAKLIDCLTEFKLMTEVLIQTVFFSFILLEYSFY